MLISIQMQVLKCQFYSHAVVEEEPFLKAMDTKGSDFMTYPSTSRTVNHRQYCTHALGQKAKKRLPVLTALYKLLHNIVHSMSVILYHFTCSGTPGCCIIACIDSEGKPQIILSARPRLVYHLNVDSVVVITGVLTRLGKICKSIKQKLHDYFLFPWSM